MVLLLLLRVETLFEKWMMFSIFLLAATSKNCPQLLLLLLMSSAAKTQIYSQEVAFNCHFCSCPVRYPGVKVEQQIFFIILGAPAFFFFGYR